MTNNDSQVKFEVSYHFTQANRCLGELTVYLPYERKGSDNIFLSQNNSVLGAYLDSDWGEYDPAYKCLVKTVQVRGKDWEEVNSLLQKMIDQATEVLNQIWIKHQNLRKQKPSDYVFYWEPTNPSCECKCNC